jgi:hypothetical protein
VTEAEAVAVMVEIEAVLGAVKAIENDPSRLALLKELDTLDLFGLAFTTEEER